MNGVYRPILELGRVLIFIYEWSRYTVVYVEDGELEAGIPQERIRARLPSCGSLAATLSPLLPPGAVAFDPAQQQLNASCGAKVNVHCQPGYLPASAEYSCAADGRCVRI